MPWLHLLLRLVTGLNISEGGLATLFTALCVLIASSLAGRPSRLPLPARSRAVGFAPPHRDGFAVASGQPAHRWVHYRHKADRTYSVFGVYSKKTCARLPAVFRGTELERKSRE